MTELQWPHNLHKFELTTRSVDLLKSENTSLHFTEEYETTKLVVRRGFKFKLLVTLSRALAHDESVEFEFRAGGRPSKRYGSLIRLPQVDPKIDDDVEGVRIIASNENILSLEIFTSGKTTRIGQWLLAMRISEPSTSRGRRRRKKTTLCAITDKIIILFNPWCKNDPVYMSNDTWRNEYVLNEEGLQYYGTSRNIGNMDWYFGQFEEVVMNAVLKLLQMMKPAYQHRNDPVEIARCMSALVNSQDDDGVLVGNWSGDFSGGETPMSWNGSVAILRKFVESGRPVKYGQCWVFSGVLTTVMRCLGVPARSLTNFDSAHDTDGNLTIDYHYDEKYKPMDNDDSVWNFHVWNDVWMAREGLPEGFGGWQAIDATPQETSGGTFRCGPASLQALKQGRVDLDFDAKFIYAEVNASKKYWLKLQAGGEGDEWRALSSETDVIGRNISTKSVGSYDRHDITNDYKHEEGSNEERMSFQMARKFVKTTHTEQPEFKKELEIDSKVASTVAFGQDLSFSIKINNLNKSETKRVHLSCVGKTMQYNGSVVGKVFDEDREEVIRGNQNQEFKFTLPAANYLSTTTGGHSLKLSVLCGVVGTSEVYSRTLVVDFVKPVIEVNVVGATKLQQSFKVQLSFSNPLSTAISGHFMIEGAGIRNTVVVPAGTIQAKSRCSKETEIVAKKLGKRRLIVGFVSDQLTGVQGNVDLNVTSA